MNRDLLRILLVLVLLTGPCFILQAISADDPEHLEKILKVKSALSRGKESLRSGHFREAVDTLEGQLTLLDDNREYLNALRDGYVGLIAELKEKKQTTEVALYERRLKALDPGAVLDMKGSGTAAVPPSPIQPLLASQPRTTPRSGVMPPAEDLDSFSDANSVTKSTVAGVASGSARTAPEASPQANSFVDQADQAFKGKNYDRAYTLYEEAAKRDPNLNLNHDVQERWAYCKLHSVANTLNRVKPGSDEIAPTILEKEVRKAMSMSVNMKGFGETLLDRIKVQFTRSGEESGSTLNIQIVHQQQQADGWSVAETTNFRIYHKQPKEYVEKVARAAEAARIQASQKWFGDVPPTWNPRCNLYLHLTGQDYNTATHQPPSCPGHSTVENEGAKILSRRIDLHIDNPNMIVGVLPHETTHVVLAGRFGAKTLPRWADEGMAVLSEPRHLAEKHLRNLPQHQRDRQLFAIADLMQFNDYPEGKYIGAFYAQSVSLVDYLSSMDTPQKFTRFIHDGLHTGWEPALQQHYNIQSFVDLQRRWQAAVFKNGSSVAQAGGNR